MHKVTKVWRIFWIPDLKSHFVFEFGSFENEFCSFGIHCVCFAMQHSLGGFGFHSVTFVAVVVCPVTVHAVQFTSSLKVELALSTQPFHHSCGAHHHRGTYNENRSRPCVEVIHIDLSAICALLLPAGCRSH